MPPPREPPLSVACYYNRVDEVRRLLAEGADPQAVAGGGPGLTNRYPAIFQCVQRGHAECLKALLTAQIDLVDSVKATERRVRSATEGVPPLIELLWCLAPTEHHPSVMPDPPRFAIRPESDPFECVRLLLDAGASLETIESNYGVSIDGGHTFEYEVYDPFEYARQSGNVDLIRMLEDARCLRYSPKTHHRFPRPARYAAAELLRLCYQIEAGVLADVWAEHVIPFLVCRTTRGTVPSLPRHVLFIDAISDSQLVAMFDSDYKEHAMRELRRRSDEMRAFYSLSESDVLAATADAIRYDAELRAAAIDGSLTLKMTRAVVVDRLDLGAGGNRRLKCYNESMMNAMCEVAGALQLEDERWH